MTALKSNAAGAILPDLSDTAGAAAPAPAVSGVEDIPVRISAVLGSTRMDVATQSRLGAGAVIELDRKVGEPIDLYVNDRLVARGELVMTEGGLGVAMTEIVRSGEE